MLKKKNISSKSYSLTLGVRQHLISFIPQRFNNRYQGLRSQGVETSGVEQSSCDSRFWVPPNRQSKMAGIILDRQRDYPANLSHFPVAFICCKQQRRNKLFFSHVRFLFCLIFFPHEQISIPGFLKTGLAKISTHSTTWQFKTIKLIQRPIKSLYLTPGSNLMVPRSIPTSLNLKWRKF